MPRDATSGLLEELGALSLSGGQSAAAAAPPAGASSLTPEEQTQVAAVFHVLMQMLEQLKTESSTPLLSTVTLDAPKLADYASVLSHAVTKFVVLSSPGELGVLPSASEELATHVRGASAVMRTMIDRSATPGSIVGDARKQQIIAAHRAILDGVRALLLQLQAHLLHRDRTKLDASLTARVCELVDKQLKLAPLTNAAAVGKSIAKTCSLIKDASAELEQLRVEEADTEQAEKEKEEEDADEEDEDMDDFADLDDGVLSASEFELVPPIRHLCSTASALVRSLYAYVLQVKIDESQQANVDWLERVGAQVQGLSRSIDDLVGSLHMQDRAAVHAAAQRIVTDMRTAALGLVQQNAAADMEWPMKSASAGADPQTSAETLAECAACQQMLAAAAELKPSDDERHAQRLQWLRKVAAQIHEGHKQMEAIQQ